MGITGGKLEFTLEIEAPASVHCCDSTLGGTYQSSIALCMLLFVPLDTIRMARTVWDLMAFSMVAGILANFAHELINNYGLYGINVD